MSLADRFCGLLVRGLGYGSGGPGSIPGTTRNKSIGSGTGSTQLREYNWGVTWWKSSGPCLENREYGRGDPSRWPRGTLYPQKLAITSGGRSVGKVRSRTQTMELMSLACFKIDITVHLIGCWCTEAQRNSITEAWSVMTSTQLPRGYSHGFCYTCVLLVFAPAVARSRYPSNRRGGEVVRPARRILCSWTWKSVFAWLYSSILFSVLIERWTVHKRSAFGNSRVYTVNILCLLQLI
jgi:hypothetical protein